ncbi:hypothetical protein MHTCC0001_36580 [Flavobacteriaceae bacterium MHTCC 0001]
MVQDGHEPGLPSPVGQEGEVGVQELKGLRLPLLQQESPEDSLVPRQEDDLQQGVGLELPSRAFQGEVEVL